MEELILDIIAGVKLAEGQVNGLDEKTYRTKREDLDRMPIVARETPGT